MRGSFKVQQHLYHGGVLDRVSVGDNSSPIDDETGARRLLLLQPLPRQGPAGEVVRAVDLRRAHPALCIMCGGMGGADCSTYGVPPDS